MTMLTTLCVSANNVNIVKTTHTHKDKPLKSPEQGCKHDIVINMLMMTVGQTSEKEERHVEETHKMTFHVCTHACY